MHVGRPIDTYRPAYIQMGDRPANRPSRVADRAATIHLQMDVQGSIDTYIRASTSDDIDG
jgi:hypothetical protein